MERTTNEIFTDDKCAILIGNREWMNQNGIALPNQVDHLMMRQEEKGQTAVLVAVNGLFCQSFVSSSANSENRIHYHDLN